jgi:hypothetical protein
VCEYLISKVPSLLSLPDSKGALLSLRSPFSHLTVYASLRLIVGRLPLHYAIMSYAPERGVDSGDVEDLLSIFVESGILKEDFEKVLSQFSIFFILSFSSETLIIVMHRG